MIIIIVVIIITTTTTTTTIIIYFIFHIDLRIQTVGSICITDRHN